MNAINDTKKTTQQIAQQIAKQMAQEPLEILKQAGKQVTGTESLPPKENQPPKKEEVTPQLKEKIEIQGERQIQALQKELQDMKGQEIFADLQRRIAEGEEVSLTDISGLTREQIEVLQAQQVAERARKEEAAKQKPLKEPVSKPSRNFVPRGQKAQAEKQKTHVERPLPPSG